MLRVAHSQVLRWGNRPLAPVGAYGAHQLSLHSHVVLQQQRSLSLGYAATMREHSTARKLTRVFAPYRQTAVEVAACGSRTRAPSRTNEVAEETSSLWSRQGDVAGKNGAYQVGAKPMRERRSGGGSGGHSRKI